ncbi:hypothetical protein BOTBODRAFT_35587 [Botryobasidium botryosum FD-172 SS1]|uniref:RING-type E3 ubiquitin transferase n=1 Tax=Botryobasidium botryosum (strain FD-172 SS1) TaxID=930990 RepID=A0A067M5I6_BOTB1|nr:hypothetical protein BOTBODRAFT_35587 [Botryobasidium botryosum FD-172 SS1]
MDDPNASQPSTSTPQDDAEKIRLKRLAKLQTRSPSPSTSAATPPPPPPSQPKPAARPIPRPTPRVSSPTPAPRSFTPRSQPRAAPATLNLDNWEPATLENILHVTLEKEHAEKNPSQIVWLRDLEEEILAEDPNTPRPIKLTAAMADRLLIARLQLDISNSIDPLHSQIVSDQTVFKYLVGCWKRLNASRNALNQKSYNPVDLAKAQVILDQVRDLIISYAGLDLQDPTMFPQPADVPLGSAELLPSLISLSVSDSYSTSSPDVLLPPTELESFLNDLGRRFGDDGLEDVLSGVISELMVLIRQDRQGLGGPGIGGQGWRAALGGLEALISVKPIAAMLTKLEEWNPPTATPSSIEHVSLIGPFARLSVFSREWPGIAQTYFSDPQKRTRADVDASNSTLRNTLHNVQERIFAILNAVVRASPASREDALDYLARVVQINVKRGGMQVDPDTVASDGFMINLQTALLRLANPFMDAKFSKIDRIDPLYYVRSSRLDISEETRINANAEDVKAFAEKQGAGGPAPNFISDIFFLASAYNHYGLVRTISTHDDLAKHVDEIQRHLETVEQDNSWVGTPMQAQAERVIERIKKQRSDLHSEIFAYQVQLLDQDLIFRNIEFMTFQMTWLIRLVDPAKKHPQVQITLPLPQEIPEAFKMLPEYFIEDVVDFFLFLVRHNPESLAQSGKNELIDFILTFLTSTWYIKNPYLKAKLDQILFYGTIAYGNQRHGVMGPLLNSHPLALTHLMPALMSFYVEVEQTGAHSQFYDKFDARRNISYIFKAIWSNPSHREALDAYAKKLETFVRFANLLMNDATYLLDESLTKLAEIHGIQTEMKDQAGWAARPINERREREKLLRQLENQATSYTTLGNSTVALLKEFTAISKAPFMTPEIIDRLAAMLNYNLDALVGPRCQDLKVENKEKYRFNPRQLLSDILQVYLNLSDQSEFARAIAGEGRSYRKGLFEKAAGFASRNHLKTDDEVAKLLGFAEQIELAKTTLEEEEDLGEIPDEFLDPLMYTLMRDPVILPSSRAVVDRSTIKAHLLSDITDPFNRSPLSLEDVVPDTTLKARIDEFIAERRNAKHEAMDLGK